MSELKSYSKEQLEAFKNELEKQYAEFKAKGLNLDMSRGKPSLRQVTLSNAMIDVITSGHYEYQAHEGTECRNYGILDGIPECKELFAELLEVEKENVMVFGNSSLNMMFDYITQCMFSGSGGKPWKDQGKIKFLCPCPGYDRHFAILEYYGIEQINVDLTGNGPDMDQVEELIKDETVKGMFCVPKYSNPTGETYSAETVERIARMKPAAKDFRILWDNAYVIHDLYDETDELVNIFPRLKEYGNEDMVIEFASTSKITFPSAGVAALAASVNNCEMIRKRMTIQTIGHDKMNMLRHVMYFENLDGIKKHMALHKAILAPKFDAVIEAFENSLSEYAIASWTKPLGGYFISLDVMPGTAKRVGQLCKEAGVTLTSVGATFPYGIDPQDQNIRIAPSFPPVDELKVATDILCVAIKLAACEKLLSEAK
ncbi:MAG: aminotransferase class I/II-fold pyridoxal phosphate-dependent enzyme [Clostridia bacterium]|nr:aminotransferase class I/II-fold pyridoxal phosphate-dependent enzyme [Clostridia bacterium]